jgi:hypothetical protein
MNGISAMVRGCTERHDQRKPGPACTGYRSSGTGAVDRSGHGMGGCGLHTGGHLWDCGPGVGEITFFLTGGGRRRPLSTRNY